MMHGCRDTHADIGRQTRLPCPFLTLPKPPLLMRILPVRAQHRQVSKLHISLLARPHSCRRSGRPEKHSRERKIPLKSTACGDISRGNRRAFRKIPLCWLTKKVGFDDDSVRLRAATQRQRAGIPELWHTAGAELPVQRVLADRFQRRGHILNQLFATAAVVDHTQPVRAVRFRRTSRPGGWASTRTRSGWATGPTTATAPGGR